MSAPPPLDPRARRLLRLPVKAPEGARDRVRQSLAANLAATDARGPQSRPDRAPSPRFPSGALTVGAFILGGFSGAALTAVLQPPRIVYVDRAAAPSVPLVAASAPQAIASATPPLDGVEPLQHAAESTGPPPPPAAPSPPRPADVTQLGAERIALDAARAALVRGDPTSALNRLADHRRRYPNGLLSEEREAMWVEALVHAGRYDEARFAAAKFRERAPQSLFQGAVETAIRSIP